MVSAISDKLSRLKPQRAMMPNVPTSESGRAAAGMIVARGLRRNTKITITTRPTVTQSVNCTSLIEARIVSVRSAKTVSWTVGGNAARRCGNRPRTRSPVSMTFAPG